MYDPEYKNAPLLPCPFCGGDARLVHMSGCQVVCLHGCCSITDSTDKLAVERWNNRPGTIKEEPVPVCLLTPEELEEAMCVPELPILDSTTWNYKGKCPICGEYRSFEVIHREGELGSHIYTTCDCCGYSFIGYRGQES